MLPYYQRLIRRARFVALHLAACFVLASCGPPPIPIGSVRGTVMYDGKPLPGGWLVLVSDSGYGASAMIGRDGKFELVSQHGKGMPLGAYKASVYIPSPFEVDTRRPGMEEMLAATKGISIPSKYSDTSTSGLSVEVAQGSNEVMIEIPGRGQKSR